MTGKAIKMTVVTGIVGMSVAIAQAATRTWDGDGGDGLWTNPVNWDGNTTVPGAGDTANISNGDTVTSPVNNLPPTFTINLTGNSTLTRPDSVIRMNGATVYVASGSGLTGNGFWDMNYADITFEDGVNVAIGSWENKGENTFTFHLGPTGFTTLTANTFYIGSGWTIADATYIVDMAGYTGGPGKIILVDYASDTTGLNNTTFQNATLDILNKAAYPNTTISWVDSTDTIELNLIDAVWDGGAGNGLWTNAVNWAGDVVPAAGNIVNISNGDTVDWDQNASLPGGLTVNLTGDSTLHSSLVLRLNGATFNVASGCALSSGVNNWFDLYNATVNFEDGAVNTVHYWEHKGSNTFGFTLSETGFATLTPNFLRPGNSATWADATYNIDISAYDRSNGSTVVLMDFANYASLGTFDPSANSPTVNITGLDGGELQWDETDYKLILKVKSFNGTIILIN